MYTYNGGRFICDERVLFLQVGGRLPAITGKLVTNCHECICIYTYAYTYMHTHTYVHTYMYIYNSGIHISHMVFPFELLCRSATGC